MTPVLLFVYALLVPLALLTVLIRYRTGLMGLTLFNLAMVASASLAGFFCDFGFGLPLDWFTTAHSEVVQYSVVGCLAMLGGMWLGWRPLAQIREKSQTGSSAYPPMPRWINPTFGWAVFALGILMNAACMALWSIPTLSTGLYLLGGLMRFGLFVLLAVALVDRNWIPFITALILSLPALIGVSVASGHTPLPLNLILPLAFIAALFRRVSVRSFVLIGTVGVVGLILMQAWMSTRGIIRSGELDQYGIVERARLFVPAFANQLSETSFDPASISATIRERIDMSDLLACQFLHQPETEPYAHGKTFLNAGVALIPRALWPGKPQIAGGSEFVARFTGIVRPEGDTTSLGLPYQFELYANGGPWLVVIGLFGVGYLAAWLELGLFRNFSSLGKLLALAVATLTVCDGGQRMNVVLPSVVAAALSAYVVGWCLEQIAPEFASRVLGTQILPAPATLEREHRGFSPKVAHARALTKSHALPQED